ncbi:MAG: hypothetical protein Q7T82_16280 [Armatimonadota bacterium]|nr:hypothetical protein [Armatimonadota bacterium]
MKGNTVYIGSLWALAVCLFCPHPSAAAGGNGKIEALSLGDDRMAEIELRGPRHTIPLGQQSSLLLQTGLNKHKQVPVTLEESEYTVGRYRIVDGLPSREGSQPARRYYCYELHSVDRTVPYSRVMWTIEHIGNFALFTDTDGKNYLAWVNRWSVEISEVSTPLSREAALKGVLSPQSKPRYEERILVPVLTGAEPFSHGVRDDYIDDIHITSVAKDESGNLTVKVVNLKEQEFTFVKKDGTWRAK